MANLSSAIANWQKRQAELQAQQVDTEKKQPAKRRSSASAKSGGARGSKAAAAATLATPATGTSKQDWRTAKVQKDSAVPIGKQLKDIVDHLESVRLARTPEQLREATQHDVTGNEELYKQVRSNPKIHLTADGKYEYKPEHELRNADELLTLLLRHPQGMLAGQIKDAYKGILDDVKKLKDDGKVWCIFNAERKEEVFFPRDSKPQVAISQDLVDFWHNIKVPEDPAVVIEELQKAKLPAAARKVARKRVTLPPKERKRGRRTVNMATATNQHMPELFVAPPPHQID
ncbi:hypothetical protein ABBQ32_000711 [Trebouxia sp. C0010 RCD-2024]